MNYLKKAISLFAALSLSLSLAITVTATAAQTVQADSHPLYAVNNDGTFGMGVEVFRDVCETTGGMWDVVDGRHVCYCWEGEFNYPYGCPEHVNNDDNNDQDHYYDQDHHYDHDQNYPFYDLAGNPDEYYILQLYDLGIIQGYPDGTFRPDQPVTRAEMAKMVLMASKLSPLPCDEDRNQFFTDLDNWQAPWVNAGYRMDIIEGYSGYDSGVRLFKPNNWVNRVEGVKLVLASFGRRPLDFEKTSFTDAVEWMVPWLEDAYRIGLIDRDYNGRFYPSEPMTRGTAARVIVKMLQYSGDI